MPPRRLIEGHRIGRLRARLDSLDRFGSLLNLLPMVLVLALVALLMVDISNRFAAINDRLDRLEAGMTRLETGMARLKAAGRPSGP